LTNAPQKRREKTYTPVLDYIPENGTPAPLLPWLRWFRADLPFDLDHINIWLMESATGWALVDTGFNVGETRDRWDGVFAATFKDKPVEDIFITHFHPDHYGLAGWLAARTGVTIRMTQKEYDMAHTLTDPKLAEALSEIYRPYYTKAGVPEKIVGDLLERRFTFKNVIYPPPETYADVGIHDIVTLAGRDWQVIAGYGHSPEHACLYNAADKVFIAGDIVLPDISPNISFFPDIYLSPDPLGAYLETLDRVKKLVPDDVMVLPSHGVPFTGLHRRIDALKDHHERRLAKLRGVLAAAGKPLSPYDAMRGLFSHRMIDRPSDIFFALGETLAHLIYDAKSGAISGMETDGFSFFQASEKA
jgi:glyoxylase-like metal-dependent hydrolase (beta-lactamase superfamily II)